MVRQNRRIERASCVQRLSRPLPLRDLKQMTCGETRITFAATNKAMKKALTAPSKPVKVTAWLTKAPRTLREEQTWSQSPETPSPWTTLYSIGPNGGPDFRKSTMRQFKIGECPLCVQEDGRRFGETQLGRLKSNSAKMPDLRMPAKTNDPKIDVDFRAVIYLMLCRS